MEALKAEHAQLTREQLDLLDPNSKAFKAAEAKRINERDPFRKGAHPLDALDVAAGRYDRRGRI